TYSVAILHQITRDRAEQLLHPPETGLFLVRESTNFPGDYTLCVSCDGKVEHYRIIYHNGKPHTVPGTNNE
uniref:SH2 domain-containing protein n=1 Tax=Seriola lalandi dorsalis TaxID=1841481 RepID=A0A3B4WPH5_SERLL